MTIDLQLNQHMMSDPRNRLPNPRTSPQFTKVCDAIRRGSRSGRSGKKDIHFFSRNDLHTSRVEIIILHFKVFHIRENDIAFDHSRENGGVADI